MRFSRKPAVFFLALAAHAELSSWVRFTEPATPLEQAFFRQMPLPGGAVVHRRPPGESAAELGKLIAAQPTEGDLYALRALESERLLDFPAAEADWKKNVELAGGLGLADYYHRRLQPNDEMRALEAAASTKADFERMIDLARAQLLPPARVESVYRQWRAKLPDSHEPYQNAIRYLSRVRQFDGAASWIGDYERRFPAATVTVFAARANLEKAKGNPRAAIDLYDRAFDPLWTAPLMQAYFELLREARSTRQFLAAARSQVQSNPAALAPATRVYHYYAQEGNPAAAARALHEFQRRNPNPAPADLTTLAKLWRQANNAGESARAWYALYKLDGREEAMAGLIDLLLTGPHRLPLGSGDLTFYRDIATADSGPGLLNAILSLLLNSSDPASRFANLEQSAVAYFEHARAAELLTLFDRRYPNSDRRPGLRAQLIQAYGAHGESDAVIKAARAYLAAFPQAAQRTQVTLSMADAFAARNQTRDEFAAYDTLLAELAASTQGEPLGRSPEYARVLDRYTARLVALKRPKDGLVLLRREIGRNPRDPGLYERLAAFLDQNKMAAEIEQVYKLAIAQFPESGWQQKLARYYLRRKQMVQFQQLTGDVVRVFSGTGLEAYFRDVVAAPNLDAALYRQVNLYANQRFPHNLTFVRNLLNAYQTRGTADPVSYENLLRRHWFYDEALRARFFEHLSRTGKLAPELAALRRETNPAATRMLAEAEAWRSHFEAAAAPLGKVYDEAPGDLELGARATSLHRSLALPTAAVYARRRNTAAPRDWSALATLGELGDREAFRRIAAIDPGLPEGYLESATLLWDYFDYDAALAMIALARQAATIPSLYAYEAGAIHENKRDYTQATGEYVRGALAEPGGTAQARLIALARRPSLRQTVDTATAGLGTEGLALRTALLEDQQRKADLEALLDRTAREAASFDLLTRVRDESRRLGFPNVEERALRREIELTTDPVDKLRARLNLARVLENRQELTQAAQTIDALYRENPAVTGIMRAAVDYHWRNGNQPRALDILAAAIQTAHASLKPALTFEFARKATAAARYTDARRSLETLLASDPHNAAYTGAMAETWAREGNEPALQTFYENRLRSAPREQVPALRRALAGVLARNNNHSAALDQYIEVLNRYPEDGALANEVAAFARRHNLQSRLTGYYQKLTTESPKDYRYHAVLARLQTALEGYPAAIAAYTRASEVRPDRTDLLEARATLEERLLRFDEAAASFAKLYELTYRSSVWMDRVAEVRARQRRPGDAVAALRQAHPDTAGGNFEIASRLESWNLLDQARTFAERAATVAGPNEVYARILARQRQYSTVTDARLLPAIADVARAEYTLEEKRQLGAYFDRLNAPAETGRRANMPAWEASKLHRDMMARPGPEMQGGQQRLIELQRHRLAFRELGAQLEAYWKVYPPQDEKPAILGAAAEAYRTSGDEAAELRVRALVPPDRRYYELLAARDPKALIAQDSDDAINAAIEARKADTALAAVAARRNVPPAWTRTYTALLGVYFDLRTPAIADAFNAALGPMRLADRIGKPTDRGQQLAGSDWFYLAARYGEYANSPGFRPAPVEESPADADLYFDLGEHELALQLDPQHIGALTALGRWKLALEAVIEQAQSRRPSYSLGEELNAILKSARGVPAESERAVVALLRRGIGGEAFMRTYAQASSSPEGAILALSRQIPNPAGFLGEAVLYQWLTAAQRDAIFPRLLEVTNLDDRSGRLQQWIELLLESNQPARARTVIASLTPTDRDRLSYFLPKAEILLAARSGGLEARLANWGTEPTDPLRDAAVELRKAGDQASARRLLRFVYERDLSEGNRQAPSFLGLAEVLIEENDTPGAVRLLRRMTLVTDPPFANHVSAARLLERHGKTQEAAAFYDEAAKATPWNRDARPLPRRTPPATLQAAETAVRNDPTDGSLKIDVFRLARAAARHQLAVAALTADGVPANHGLEKELADSYAKLGQFDRAVALVPDNAAWRSAMERRRQNLEHAPVVSKNLKQDRIVRRAQ